MYRNVTFILTILVLFGGLSWWSGQSEIAKSFQVISAKKTVDHSELIEVLDRLVAYERYYHSVYGRFTKILNRIGYSIPRAISGAYDIHVADASEDKLVLTAVSEANGKSIDVVSINQDFQLTSNFALPAPRLDYLKLQALKQLRLIQESPSGQIPEEQGVFKGYFKYEARQDSYGKKSVVALGIKDPVMGIQLDLDPKNSEAIIRSELASYGGGEGEEGEDEVEVTPEVQVVSTGQNPETGLMSSQEEAYLAQKIFRGEMGRYAKNWEELSRITHFRFEGKDEDIQASRGLSSVSDASLSTQSNAPQDHEVRVQTSQDLEIEPIRADEI